MKISSNNSLPLANASVITQKKGLAAVGLEECGRDTMATGERGIKISRTVHYTDFYIFREKILSLLQKVTSLKCLYHLLYI